MILKRTYMLAIACLTLGTLTPALSASAAEWSAWKGQSEVAPLAIYTDGSDETGAMLVCDGQGMMKAVLSLEPASLPDLLARNASYSRSTKVNIQVGDTPGMDEMFRYIPAIKSIETKSHSVAAKVFNSAVLGEPLMVVTKREGSVETQLPAPTTHSRPLRRPAKPYAKGNRLDCLRSPRIACSIPLNGTEHAHAI